MPLVVFVVSNSTFFPFIAPKNLVFRSLVEATFIAWVALAAIEIRWRPRASIILAAVVAFVAVVALADTLGVNPTKSIWSNFERMEGLVTLLHLLAYTVVAASMFSQKQVSLWFWRASLGVASIVSLHAIIQFITTGKQRLDATLGNPIYLAVFALFHIFIALILLARRNASTRERVLYSLVLPLLFWVLFMTATRGAILGVLGGLLLAGIGIIFTLRRNTKIQFVAGALVAFILIGMGSFFLARESAFVQENTVLKRFASISLTEGTVFARTIVWSMAWEGVKERPVLGWGQENFSIVFNKYYDPRMYAQEPWFDRTHNIIFDWLIAAGVLGLLAYISIFLALLWMIYKTKNFTVVQKWFLLGLLAAYSFHNLTVFDQVTSYILFFSLVAWIIAATQDVPKKILWFSKKTLTARWWVLAVVVLVASILVVTLNQKVWQANTFLLGGLRDVSRARQAGESGDTKTGNALATIGLEKIILSAQMHPTATQEAHELLAQTARQYASAPWVSDSLRQRWFDASVQGLEFEISRTNGEARFYVFLANLYSSFNQLELEKKALLQAQEISPNKQAILIELAANALRRGKDADARALLKQAYELEKSYPTAGVLYAIRLIEEKDTATFDDIFSGSLYIGNDSRILSVLIIMVLMLVPFPYGKLLSEIQKIHV